MGVFWSKTKRWEESITMKTKIFASVAVLIAVSSAGWALPAVQLSPSCSYVLNIDSLGGFAMSSLGLGDYATADLNGDGVPDSWEFALLGAALCSGDAGLLAQWNANNAALLAFFAQFGTFNTQAAGVATEYGDLLAPLTAFWNANGPAGTNLIPAPAQPLFILLLQGLPKDSIAPGVPPVDLPKLAGADHNNLAYLFGNAAAILGALSAVAPWFDAMNGLDTAMQAYLGGIWTAFFGAFPAFGGALLAPGFGYVAAMNTAAAVASGLGDPTLAASLATAATDSTTLGTTMVGLPTTLPVMEIYGVAKTATEPFSGSGDYNGNGDTNKQVYDSVVATGGNRAAFVADASGFNVWYQGNPALPAVGLIGLALLTGVTALGGALSIRKK